MADVDFSSRVAAKTTLPTALQTTDYVPVVRSGTLYKATSTQITSTASFGGVYPSAALADGTTDDSAALSTAMASAVTLGTSLYLKAGATYRVNSKLTAVTSGNLRIEGNGATISFMGADTSGGVIAYTATGRVEINDLTVLANATTVLGSLHGIAITNATRVRLERVSAKSNWNTGIDLTNVTDSLCLQCHLESNKYGGIVQQGYGMTVLGCFFKTNGISGGGSGYGVATRTITGAETQNTNIIIADNRFDSPVRKAIDFHNGNGVVVISNIIWGTVTDAGSTDIIYALAEDSAKDIENVAIINNRIDITDNSGGAIGIRCGGFGNTGLSDLGDWLVQGNYVRGTDSFGIYCEVGTQATAAQIKSYKILDNTVVMLTNGSGVDGISVGQASAASTTAITIADVRGNTVRCAGNQSSGIQARLGIKCLNIVDNNITIAGTVTYGIRVVANEFFRIQHNTIDGAATTGISTVGTADIRDNNWVNGTIS